MADSELTDRQQKQLDFLLQDFSSIKAEIARRSNMQRFVLLSYIAFLVIAFREGATSGITGIWVVAVWWGAAMAANFYFREHLTIKRLGLIIKDKIAPSASSLLGVQKTDLFHSETDRVVQPIHKYTSRYDNQFNWVLFWIVPCGLTLLHIIPNLEGTPDPWITLFAGLGTVYVALLLTRHVWLRGPWVEGV